MAQLVQSEEPLHPYFDGDYVRSLPGIARLIEVGCSIAAFISILIVHYQNIPVYIGAFTSVVGFTVSFILLWMYIFHLVELSVERINWLMLEMIYTLPMVILYLLTFALMIHGATTWASTRWSWGAASFFCGLATVTFAYDFYCKLMKFRRREPPQKTYYYVNHHENL